jgi:hypothetical protein
MVVFVVIIKELREELLASIMTPVIYCGTRVQCVVKIQTHCNALFYVYSFR